MENQFNIMLALPEVILAVMAIGILLIESFVKSHHARFSYVASLLTLAGLFVLQACLACQFNGATQITFYQMFVVDGLSHLLKLFSYVAVALTLIYGRAYMVERDMIRGGEAYALTLLALLGQMVIISAANLITIYLGLELMSLSLYALIAVRRDHRVALESAMKYFVLGSLASGFLLYGVSLIYGATGELSLSGVLEQATALLYSDSDQLPILLLGLVFVVGGLAFKLGAVPFHMWVPDVYQGSPTSVTLTLAAAPKLAVLAMVFRLLFEGLGTVGQTWQPMLLILAVLSLLIGNLTAIVQTNFKRMLAYSTISQIGFVILGMVAGADQATAVSMDAYTPALFYMVIYVLTTLATFGMILLLSRADFESEEIADLAGLNKRRPVLALGLLLLMFSLAGIPPLAGFVSKLYVLQALVDAGYLYVAIFAVVMSLIGAFYYLRVVKVIYFDPAPEDTVATSCACCPCRGIVLALNIALVLVLGIVPSVLIDFILQLLS